MPQEEIVHTGMKGIKTFQLMKPDLADRCFAKDNDGFYRSGGIVKDLITGNQIFILGLIYVDETVKRMTGAKCSIPAQLLIGKGCFSHDCFIMI